MTLAADGKTGLAERGRSPLLTGYSDESDSWALRQAALLRAGRADQIGAQNPADESTASVHDSADKLRSDLCRVPQHLLTWDFQSAVRKRSLILRIEEHRRRVAEHLERDPGLDAILPSLSATACRAGRRHALDEAGLPQTAIPQTCSYSWDEIMTRPIAWSDEP